MHFCDCISSGGSFCKVVFHIVSPGSAGVGVGGCLCSQQRLCLETNVRVSFPDEPAHHLLLTLHLLSFCF